MPLKLRETLPDLSGATEWINGEIDKARIEGKPLLVHFWAVSCYMCKESLPTLNEWRDKYGKQYNLQLLGVHMPRSEKDTDLAAVRDAVAQYELKHPILVDNEHNVTDAFQNEYVPAYYLFDEQGQMRFYGAGEKAIGLVEQRLHKILGPKDQA
ncbi:redoxin domain-containing protein [Paenibacillus thermoaerophilus]|uniref:Redoxin domain-containing protein n=1 Tax=Paenibacillus thermoaerophilus TaxID=1215385 RepID=A0ABW2V822_9BACL|nr:redoxin domain-containing protein [Paenibacillus thermoaerophilus]TMV15942.1 redoxin domain-containing protein [Paenibacillus thermoaerophilus]